MSEHHANLAADLETARKRFGSSVDGTLQLTNLEEDEGAVSFHVEGFGEYTVFVPDPYPGETTVFGPDDFELNTTGTIENMLEGVLSHLQKPAALVLSRATSEVSTNSFDGGEEDCFQASDMDNVLEKHLELAREFLGDSNVELAELAQVWRVRLRFGLEALAGPSAGEALIDPTTAGAWGMNSTLPLSIELHLPKKGYLTQDMPTDFVNAVWQHDSDQFLLDKQLVQILNDFGAFVLLGKPLLDEEAVDVFSAEEIERMHEYHEKKVQMISEAQGDAALGFLVHLVLYAQSRLPKLHEYCALCDKPHTCMPMLLRTVCNRELCRHQFSAFGQRITSAEGVNTQAEIVELLVFMLAKAAESYRKELVLDPYPSVYAGETEILSAKKKDNARLQSIVSELLQLRSEHGPSLGAGWTTRTTSMSVPAVGLVQWVLASNRSYLAPLNEYQRIQDLGTTYQYLLISAPPEKETAFQKGKAECGSFFAFHGSHVGNWHSIFRNGLKNASDTALMSAGAAYGPGIYLAKSSGMSKQYCHMSATSGYAPQTSPPVLKRQITGNRFLENAESITMMALCEVVDHASVQKHGWGYVAPEEWTVCTRFFLVFDRPTHDVNISECLCQDIQRCMDKLNVGLAGHTGTKAVEQVNAESSLPTKTRRKKLR